MRNKRAQPAPGSLSHAWSNYSAALKTGDYVKIQIAVGGLLLHPKVLKVTAACSIIVIVGTVFAVMALVG